MATMPKVISDFTKELREAQNKLQLTRFALSKLTNNTVDTIKIKPSNVGNIVADTNEKGLVDKLLLIEEKRIYDSLNKISPALARGYAQAKADLQDDERSSWAGTAHEIREVLATLLRTLAPDNEVTKQSWYQKEENTPTQKQRTRYILQQHNAGSKELEVAGQVSHLEEMIGDLVRATYSRASDAAHRAKEKREVARIVNYFDAFAYDLLNLD